MRSRHEQSRSTARCEVAIDKLNQMGVKVSPASRSDYLARRINDVMSWDLGGDAMAVIRMFVAHKPLMSPRGSTSQLIAGPIA